MSEDTPCPLCKAHTWEGARTHYESCELMVYYNNGLEFARKQITEEASFNVLEVMEEIRSCVVAERDAWLMVEIMKVWQAGYKTANQENFCCISNCPIHALKKAQEND